MYGNVFSSCWVEALDDVLVYEDSESPLGVTVNVAVAVYWGD